MPYPVSLTCSCGEHVGLLVKASMCLTPEWAIICAYSAVLCSECCAVLLTAQYSVA